MEKIAGALASSRSRPQVINGLFEEQSAITRSNVAYKYPQDPPWIGQDYLGVDLEVCLATVAYQDKLAFWEILQDALQ